MGFRTSSLARITLLRFHVKLDSPRWVPLGRAESRCNALGAANPGGLLPERSAGFWRLPRASRRVVGRGSRTPRCVSRFEMHPTDLPDRIQLQVCGYVKSVKSGQ